MLCRFFKILVKKNRVALTTKKLSSILDLTTIHGKRSSKLYVVQAENFKISSLNQNTENIRMLWWSLKAEVVPEILRFHKISIVGMDSGFRGIRIKLKVCKNQDSSLFFF